MFKPLILHVDEAVLNLDPAQRLNNIREKLIYIADFTVQGYLSTEDPYRVVEFKSDGNLDIQIQDDLVKSFESIRISKRLQPNKNFLSNLRRQAIVEGAQKLGCEKVSTAENATKISIDLLTLESPKGKGGEILPRNIRFQRDSRNENMMVLRPLRDVARKRAGFCTRSSID